MLLKGEKRDTSRMDKETTDFLDFEDYKNYVENEPGEKPEIINDIIFHLTGVVQETGIH